MWKKLRNKPLHVSNVLKLQRRRRKVTPKKNKSLRYNNPEHVDDSANSNLQSKY
jgi:hypothetical protein